MLGIAMSVKRLRSVVEYMNEDYRLRKDDIAILVILLLQSGQEFVYIVQYI